MIEVLAAMFILIVGIVSVASLLLVSQKISRSKTNEVIATNLAREGVEVARGIRDSNWLAMEAGDPSVTSWDQGLYFVKSDGSVDYDGIAKLDPNTYEWSLNFSPYKYNQLLCKIYFNKINNLYTHDSLNSAPTIFTRFLKLYPICQGGDIIISGTCADWETEKIGIQVISRVSWKEEGVEQNKYIEERIYDWKSR